MAEIRINMQRTIHTTLFFSLVVICLEYKWRKKKNKNIRRIEKKQRTLKISRMHNTEPMGLIKINTKWQTNTTRHNTFASKNKRKKQQKLTKKKKKKKYNAKHKRIHTALFYVYFLPAIWWNEQIKNTHTLTHDNQIQIQDVLAISLNVEQ